MATGMTPASMSMASSRMVSGFQGRVVTAHFPKLVREAAKPVTLTPSALQKEMSLTTKQRLASIREVYLPRIVQRQDRSGTSHDKFSAVDPDQALFQPFPSEVVFQNFVPHKVCEMPLVLRNVDKVPRLVKVTLETSPYFKLVGPSGVYRKVPPGMCSTLRILFTPGENKDYRHQVLCITEREEFIVPIWAIGARAVLDFPDQLDFSVCPVKYSTKKTLLVHNLGNREACYQISTQRPFSVIPAMGTLGIGDTMQVTVEFHPLQAGGHSASLVVHYDTGEDTHTSLHGSAMNVHIRLDRNSVTVEKTYITLSNHSTVMIHNQSNVTAHFQWKGFATQEEEDRLKQRLCHKLHRREKDKVDNFLKWGRVDTTCRECLSLLSRIFQRERAKVQEDPILFSDGIFTIEPVEGEILPNSSEEINVFFKPQEARVYKQAAYCDISGRETRLPLHLIGEGLGPQLHFHFEELDIGKVYVIAVHRYEAILCNKGPIEGPFRLIPPTTTIGSCFTFLPQWGIIAPDGLQAIQISFRTTIPGEFKEEFQFSVTESPKPVTLTIRGCVIGPTFHFNVPALHFGDISFGFPRTLSCRLTNTSLMPMTFNLRIPEDGLGEPSTTSFVQISRDAHPSWRKRTRGLMEPMEFTIKPCRGTICPQEFQDIQVTLCSNTVGRYKMELVVDVDDVGKKMSALPLTARCVVPPLRVLNPIMTFGRCCLKVPYQKMLTLVNDSDFPGCYGVLPQEDRKDAAVWYSSPAPCGIIKAHSSVEIPFILEAQLLGDHDIIADVAVFGNEESPLNIHLESTGQGPVVYVYPNEINLGTIQVLQDISQTLHLSNQSVIPAVFWAEMAGTRSRWRTEPSKGVIPPKTEVSVSVTANLDDTGKSEDEVKLFIENSHTKIIPVQAVGIGTTIVTDKPFAPELSFKPHFSLTPCYYQFKITNKGRHVHHLYWTTEGFSISQQRRALGTTKGKKPSETLRPISPVFKLQPPQMGLMPGQTMDMVLEGFSSTPQEVKERLLCHAIVGREKTKKQIMQVDVTCEFIFPVVEISSRAILFRVEKRPTDVLTLQYKPLSFKNASSLPLSIVLDLKQPFLICDVDQQPLPADAQPMKLEAGEELHLCIQFNPAYKKDLNSWVEEKILNMGFVEHPHEEQISIRGEVYFPNLHIQTKALDFGCIMNNTEEVRYVEMTNCSPIPVHYHWSFQTDSQVNTIRFTSLPPKFKPKPPMEERDSLEYSVLTKSHFSTESVEDPTKALEAVQDPAQQPADSEASLGAVQDSSQQTVGSENSLESEVLSSSVVELQSLSTIKGLGLFVEVEHPALGAEEVFDVLPVSGVLQPGESQHVPFTFFGHANIVARVMALCHVEGGPTYEVQLTGEASGLSYYLNFQEIDCRLQLFNEVLETEVILQNTGKIGFTYMVLNPSTATADCPLPGVPVVVPSIDYIEPGKEQVLKIYYLPGVPGVFFRTFQLQVGHLEPAEISLRGEGVFLRISLDLPWNVKGNEKYEKILKQAKENLEEDRQSDAAALLSEPASVQPPMDDSGIKKQQQQLAPDDSSGDEKYKEILREATDNPKEERQSDEAAVLSESASMEPLMDDTSIEKQQHLLAPGYEKYKEMLKEAKEKLEEDMQINEAAAMWDPESVEPSVEPSVAPSVEPSMGPHMADSDSDSDIVWDTWLQMEMEQVLVEQHALELQRTVTSRPQENRVFDNSIRQRLVDVELPAYILNVGSVIQGNVERHTVNITNTGLFPVSFRINKHVLHGTGFSVGLDKVQCLPYCNTEKFEVLFDSANIPFGEVDVLLPIKVAGGFTVHIHLYATVTEPRVQKEVTSHIPWIPIEKLERRSGQSSESSRSSFDFSYQSIVFQVQGPSGDGEKEDLQSALHSSEEFDESGYEPTER